MILRAVLCEEGRNVNGKEMKLRSRTVKFSTKPNEVYIRSGPVTRNVEVKKREIQEKAASVRQSLPKPLALSPDTVSMPLQSS